MKWRCIYAYVYIHCLEMIEICAHFFFCFFFFLSIYSIMRNKKRTLYVGFCVYIKFLIFCGFEFCQFFFQFVWHGGQSVTCICNFLCNHTFVDHLIIIISITILNLTVILYRWLVDRRWSCCFEYKKIWADSTGFHASRSCQSFSNCAGTDALDTKLNG